MTNNPNTEKLVAEIHDVTTDLVRSVVRNPDRVNLIRKDVSQLVAFSIKTDQDDVRRVVGARGKHFRALETIVGAMLKRAGRDSHVAIDESPNAAVSVLKKEGALGGFNARQFKDASKLLKRVVVQCVHEPERVEVTSTDVGATSILEIKIKTSDFDALRGEREVDFDYGPDGDLIGSIKNLFDGIGKNNGRVLKLVVTKI
jgi:predicted RNA-binding protein YlqC (UPF0109 family)